MKTLFIALLLLGFYACGNPETPANTHFLNFSLDSIAAATMPKYTPKIEIVPDTPRLGMTIREYVASFDSYLSYLEAPEDTATAKQNTWIDYYEDGGSSGHNEAYRVATILPNQKQPTVLIANCSYYGNHGLFNFERVFDDEFCLEYDLEEISGMSLETIKEYDTYPKKEQKRIALYKKHLDRMIKSTEERMHKHWEEKYFFDDEFSIQVKIYQFQQGKWQILNDSVDDKNARNTLRHYVPFFDKQYEKYNNFVYIYLDDVLVQENREWVERIFGKKKNKFRIKASETGIITLIFSPNYQLSFTWRNGKFVWTKLPEQIPPALVNTLPCGNAKKTSFEIRGFIGTDSTTTGTLHAVGIEAYRKSWFKYKDKMYFFDGNLLSQTGTHLYTQKGIKIEGRFTDCSIKGTFYYLGKPMPFEWTLTPK